MADISVTLLDFTAGKLVCSSEGQEQGISIKNSVNMGETPPRITGE